MFPSVAGKTFPSAAGKASSSHKRTACWLAEASELAWDWDSDPEMQDAQTVPDFGGGVPSQRSPPPQWGAPTPSAYGTPAPSLLTSSYRTHSQQLPGSAQYGAPRAHQPSSPPAAYSKPHPRLPVCSTAGDGDMEMDTDCQVPTMSLPFEAHPHRPRQQQPLQSRPQRQQTRPQQPQQRQWQQPQQPQQPQQQPQQQQWQQQWQPFEYQQEAPCMAPCPSPMGPPSQPLRRAAPLSCPPSGFPLQPAYPQKCPRQSLQSSPNTRHTLSLEESFRIGNLPAPPRVPGSLPQSQGAQPYLASPMAPGGGPEKGDSDSDFESLHNLLALASQKRALAAMHCEQFTEMLEGQLTKATTPRPPSGPRPLQHSGSHGHSLSQSHREAQVCVPDVDQAVPDGVPARTDSLTVEWAAYYSPSASSQAGRKKLRKGISDHGWPVSDAVYAGPNLTSMRSEGWAEQSVPRSAHRSHKVAPYGRFDMML